MRIDVFANYKDANERKIRNHTVVVLDILRASTTILEALEVGAESVIPVTSLEEAVAIRRARGGSTTLAGEREGKPIEGFDLGNSPIEFTPERVDGKVVVMATSNGSKAIRHLENCETILIGTLRNRRRLCEFICELNDDLALVCAGTDGNYSADDIYGAGAIINGLRSLGQDFDFDDMGLVAENFYLSAREDYSLLHGCKHYQRLLKLGYTDDLEFCFEEDVSDVIPRYEGGAVKRMR